MLQYVAIINNLFTRYIAMTGFHWKLKLAVITLLSGSIAAIFSILLLFPPLITHGFIKNKQEIIAEISHYKWLPI